jgi:transglutaminase-like putative cysteine protease
MVSFDVLAPTTFAFQVVAANGSAQELHADSNGWTLYVEEANGPEPYGRQHIVRAPVGQLTVRYAARVTPGDGEAAVVDAAERIEMLRPSRFCASDRLVAYGATRLPGPGTDTLTRIQAIVDYVHEHVAYTPGSTGPTDDAVSVLLSGEGVCRDFAHLVITLARAGGIPARFVSVYAPGLSPMDFHAVAEVEVNGTWHVFDATRLAPRDSFVRIATGRDAADTAFATTLDGVANLTGVSVTAVAEGWLPTDDGNAPTRMS